MWWRNAAFWEMLGKCIAWPLLTVGEFFVFQENDACCTDNFIGFLYHWLPTYDVGNTFKA